MHGHYQENDRSIILPINLAHVTKFSKKKIAFILIVYMNQFFNHFCTFYYDFKLLAYKDKNN